MPKLLAPLSTLWCWGADYRQSGIESYRPTIPVICIGNIIAGGAGKTPIVMALTRLLKNRGRTPHLLTRGYGGSEIGPVRVDPSKHTPRQVGDEALLLAQLAPTWVSRWRPEGATAAAAAGAPLILMDDGFQNHTLAKDLSFLVIDGGYGFGNGRVIPAGPCREPIKAGVARAHAAIIIGEDLKNVAGKLFPLPIFRARQVPDPDAWALKDQRLLAFAGIGRPAKFFDMLQHQIGANLVETALFRDHHPYSNDDMEGIVSQARDLDARPVTTAKDWVRIPAPYQDRVTPVGMSVEFLEPDSVMTFMAKKGVL